MENNNWGAPQQQGAQWPGAAGFQPALGPYAAYGAYPPMAPRAYPMLMAAPAQQAMLAAAPAQQLAPPPPPLPRAAPKDISTWLNEVKPGYGEKYASIFEDLGVDDEDDVQNLRDDLARDLRAALDLRLEEDDRLPETELAPCRISCHLCNAHRVELALRGQEVVGLGLEVRAVDDGVVALVWHVS